MPAVSLRLLLSLSIAVMLACAPRDSSTTSDRIDALEDSISALTEALRGSVDLKPGDGSFSVLRIDVGSLALTLDSVIALDGGSGLALTIANLTSAEIDGLTGSMGWGIPEGDGTHTVDERRSRALALSQPLPPGVWTSVTVPLASVPPDQVQFLRLSEISASSLRLP